MKAWTSVFKESMSIRYRRTRRSHQKHKPTTLATCSSRLRSHEKMTPRTRTRWAIPFVTGAVETDRYCLIGYSSSSSIACLDRPRAIPSSPCLTWSGLQTADVSVKSIHRNELCHFRWFLEWTGSSRPRIRDLCYFVCINYSQYILL